MLHQAVGTLVRKGSFQGGEWRRAETGVGEDLVEAKALPCNHIHCKRCPTKSFTSPNINLSYPITTLADRKSSNIVNKLQCTKCNVFYIGGMFEQAPVHLNNCEF